MNPIVKRVALYGGAFDPPHQGHLSIIANLCSLPFLNEIWVLPCGDRTDKKLLFNMTERFDLLTKILNNTNGMTKVRLCKDEIVLSKQLKRMIPTIELLEHLQKKYPSCQFHFVVGADIFSTINTWQQYRKLLQDHKFIVYPRSGYDKENFNSQDSDKKPAHYFFSSFLPADISSSAIKKTLLDQQLSKLEKREKVSVFLDPIAVQMLEAKQYL